MYTIEMVKSRYSRMKGMMLVASLSRPLYWLSHGLAHGGLFVVSATVSFLVMQAMGMDGPINNTFVAYIVVFVLYAPAGVLYGYCYSFLADKPSDAEQFVQESQQLLVLIVSHVCVFPCWCWCFCMNACVLMRWLSDGP
jgi:hypothetical protein